MVDGNVEEKIQFSLEAVGLNEDIEMAGELFRNGNVEEDRLLLEEEKKTEKESKTFFLLSPFPFIIFSNLLPGLNLEHPSFHFLSY